MGRERGETGSGLVQLSFSAGSRDVPSDATTVPAAQLIRAPTSYKGEDQFKVMETKESKRRTTGRTTAVCISLMLDQPAGKSIEVLSAVCARW